MTSGSFVARLLVFVDVLRVFQDRVGGGPGSASGGAVQAPEKTTAPSSMAGNAAMLFHFRQNDIAIAVQPDFVHGLHMAGFFAFPPQSLARTRPVCRVPPGPAFGTRFAVRTEDGRAGN